MHRIFLPALLATFAVAQSPAVMAQSHGGLLDQSREISARLAAIELDALRQRADSAAFEVLQLQLGDAAIARDVLENLNEAFGAEAMDQMRSPAGQSFSLQVPPVALPGGLGAEVQQTLPPETALSAFALQAAGNAIADGIETLKRGRDPFVHVFHPAAADLTDDDLRIRLFQAIGLEAPNDSVNLSNTTIPAGYTFLGQFIDHDVTLNLERPADATDEAIQLVAAGDATLFAQRIAVDRAVELVNERTARLDLDSVYGGTPAEVRRALQTLIILDPTAQDTVLLYETDVSGAITGKLRVTERGTAIDLPRCGDGGLEQHSQCRLNNDGDIDNPLDAVIGDPRNDENIIIAQIHALFIRAHNKLVDEIIADDPGVAPLDALASARRRLSHSWARVVRDDYLRRHLDTDTYTAVVDDTYVFYRTPGTDAPFCQSRGDQIPHEFALAAFRFGHSQVRGGYLINLDGNAGSPFGAGFNALFGGQLIEARNRLDFSLFFTDDGTPNRSTKFIDTILSENLHALQTPAIPEDETRAPTLKNLASRNIARVGAANVVEITPAPEVEVTLKPVALLSGVQVANEVRKALPSLPELTQEDVNNTRMAAIAGGDAPFALADLPLWTYVLAEAEQLADGQTLGPLGGIIVGETLNGILNCDPDGLDRTTLEAELVGPDGRTDPAHYRMADIIAFVEAP